MPSPSLPIGGWGTAVPAAPGQSTTQVLPDTTVTFTWQSSRGNPAPKTVVVKETRTLNCAYAPTGGSPEIEGTKGTETKFLALDSSSGTFTCRTGRIEGLARNPASATVTQGISAYASYTAEPTSVVLSLTGTIMSNGKHNILIGQGCTATLSAGSYALSNFSWSVPGDYFGAWVIDDFDGVPRHSYVLAPNLSSASAHWYWKKGGTGDVTCTATATIDGRTYQVTGGQYVGVWEPYCDVRYNLGNVRVLPSGLFGLFGSPVGDGRIVDGMTADGMVRNPDLFAQLGGTICWAQLAVNTNTTWTSSDGVVHRSSQDGIQGLDDGGLGYWQLYGYTYPADGTYNFTPIGAAQPNNSGHQIYDSPAMDLRRFPNVVNATRGFQADTWLMYHPGGDDWSWVPLYKFGWGFNGNASGPVVSDPYGLFEDWTASGNSFDHGKTYLPDFPIWSRIISEHPSF